ncbi:peptidoglycan editing factor PgeF [Coprococcus catus]|uniref:peptidoglycan editing factor PgeF n=1 Tax=Coprococcus catus TaxID=116085 RepID=UPI0015C06EBD|nr:peptidoglycan editing factor PgeF [Coprococcus catus]MBT9771786.1 peptidoglycan editing factor PgeF [Coprococcus catus]MBX9229986.1 peptidoglycan editing factor PgeF [Coprococcus catus]MCT6798953.1 peptidoglycan editing factor PgeF [Coprococcus catus]MEE0140107.1 peptidoglycan editing factor PgeF [Coprococcus sp.]
MVAVTGSGTTELKEKNHVPYIQFKNLSATGIVKHGFSTRKGGVSTGIFSSMNLNFKRGDDPDAVMENYRRMAAALNMRVEDMVLSDQTHTTNVRVITEEDRGKGILKPQDYSDVDGMITNVPGIVLVTSYADCVPLYFVDPVRKAIGLSHSGWKGTVGHIGQKTVWKMHEVYGSEPKDIVAAIGPSICQSCYEVSDDVAEAFRANFTADEAADILLDKGNGKYQLDLWKANWYVLTDAGILPEHLSVTDLCTACHPDLLWSHRKTNGQRGGLSAFLSLIDTSV